MKINRKKIFPIIAAVALFIAQLACDEGPKPPCADACGLTSPVTDVEQKVIDALAPDAQNILSGGN